LILKFGYQGFFDQTFWGAPEYMSSLAECWFYLHKFVNKENSKKFENAESVATEYLRLSQIHFTTRSDIKIAITKSHGRHIV